MNIKGALLLQGVFVLLFINANALPVSASTATVMKVVTSLTPSRLTSKSNTTPTTAILKSLPQFTTSSSQMYASTSNTLTSAATFSKHSINAHLTSTAKILTPSMSEVRIHSTISSKQLGVQTSIINKNRNILSSLISTTSIRQYRSNEQTKSQVSLARKEKGTILQNSLVISSNTATTLSATSTTKLTETLKCSKKVQPTKALQANVVTRSSQIIKSGLVVPTRSFSKVQSTQSVTIKKDKTTTEIDSLPYSSLSKSFSHSIKTSSIVSSLSISSTKSTVLPEQSSAIPTIKTTDAGKTTTDLPAEETESENKVCVTSYMSCEVASCCEEYGCINLGLFGGKICMEYTPQTF